MIITYQRSNFQSGSIYVPSLDVLAFYHPPQPGAVHGDLCDPLPHMKTYSMMVNINIILLKF